MKNYLTSEDRSYILSLGVPTGTQVNVDHLACPAGRDTKKRLYVKATDDGAALVAYCHHCTGRMFIPLRTNLRALEPGANKTLAELGRLDMVQAKWEMEFGNYQSCETRVLGSVVDDWKKWPLKYFSDCTMSVVARLAYGMRVRNNGWVYIPKYSGEVIVGLAVRPMGPGSKKWVKVINHAYADASSRLSLYDSKPERNTVVLCEDPISAMKIDIAGAAGCALEGTTIDTADLLRLSQKYDKCMVWLDNDNDAVEIQAYTLLKTAGMFFDSCSRNYTDKDPKHYPIDYIKGLIND